MIHFRYFVVKRCEMHDKLTECYNYLLSDDVRAQVEDEEVVVLE